MNLNPATLRNRFLAYHASTTRHIQNRDTAVLESGGWGAKNRLVLKPTKWTWAQRGRVKYVEPDPKTEWHIILYNTAIVVVQPDGSFSLHTEGWDTSLTARYIYNVTGFYLEGKRLNQWTPSVLLIHFANSVCLFKDGMKFVDGRPINPEQPKTFKPDYTHSEIKEFKRKLKEVRARYLPLARMHATTPKGVNPFEGVAYCDVTWEDLVGETEATTETYVALVKFKRWNFDPLKALERALHAYKIDVYKRHLKESE